MRGKAAIILAIAVLVLAFVLMVAAMLPRSWWETKPPKHPMRAQVLSPSGGKTLRVPKGARVEPSGYLTILEVPPTPGEPQPHIPSPSAVSPPPEPRIPPEIAGGIRLFATVRAEPVSSQSFPTILLPPPHQVSRVILRDGCFRLADEGEPLLVFAVGTRLKFDAQGYLAFDASADGSISARVGELVVWEGERRPLTDASDLASIHARCGAGNVEVIGPARSVSASQAQADGQAATRLSEMYGIPWNQALSRVRACRQKMSRGPNGEKLTIVDNVCGSTPPPPVTDQAQCPAGTKLSAGLCRTPEGYVRPIPPGI